MAEGWKPRQLPLLLAASLLTLVVTIVRVAGELEGWSAGWFDATAYSPWNPFGIVWLVPVFGFLFGRRLAMQGSRAPFVPAFFVFVMRVFRRGSAKAEEAAAGSALAPGE